ncbi:conserved hypothetical protein [Leishmania mexicana MHOM/GT/2001/U1103]|uniref:Pentacotripeptide-repeat region of PRORP domain-containing protein n=1 Tax=Leishmania mexicana (strain MHOM/GT/2001/U1103) TaxID=929439 RepID=E9AZR9_LEIMU|nr:conserved hypothetical protein [Leishmania mexicana MHOM/GT/2001/U1103]CBZ28470.1 conserved hypothetical protein [Leishmania mexicana MHOM/GT/2001/U1103]
MDKKTALAQLRQSKFVYERGLERQEAERRAKLHRFLDQHKHASQWATSLAALLDAVRHGVMPSDAALCRAMCQCGQRGQLQAAKQVYVDLYRRIGRPRPLTAHVAFMSACADAGDFAEAHRQFRALRDRDVAQHAKNASHCPVVNDDLTTEYLRAALCASLGRRPASGEERAAAAAGAASIPVTHTQGSSASESFQSRDSPTMAKEEGTRQAACRSTHRGRDDGYGGKPRADATKEDADGVSVSSPWQVALEEFVALRKNAEVFRKSNELTPLLLETATQLACVGRQWQLCLSILRGAEAEQALIPPEAYDASIRACYQAQKHAQVVRLMEQLIATRVPPDERSVRLALAASEEVSAEERSRQTLSSSTTDGVGRGGRGWSMALTLFQALERNGFPLYQQSYEAPLRACVNAGRWKDAFKMLDVMRRDHRPVSAPVYAQALASRIEAATAWAEVRRLMRASSLAEGHASVVVLYLAALRACVRLRDWKHFAELNREMRDRDIPETYDKMRLLIEAAYLQEQYHSVLMRFARFENITQYERRRVVDDKRVRLYEEDFALPPALLDMVLAAFEKVKGHADPMVEAAYQAALRHKERVSGGQSLAGAHTAPDEWMYSQKAREARTSPEFH